MSYSKQAEARQEAQRNLDDAPPPAYENADDAALAESSMPPSFATTVQPSSSQSQPQFPSIASPGLTDDKKAPTTPSNPASRSNTNSSNTAGPSTSEAIPTIDSPFNFPPAYTLTSTPSSSGLTARPIAIPQISPSPTSRFLSAYSPLLLSYGITSPTFTSFLDTISAFLTAKVSDRAISHAGDMAKTIGEQHKNSFKNVVSHAKAVGKDIGKNAKKGNVIGAALGVVGGAVTIPLFTVGGLIGSAASLPGMTIAAAVKKPKTPRQRAVAYIAVANEKWFTPRGLYAVLLDSQELAEVLKVPVSTIATKATGDEGPAQIQLQKLDPYIEALEVQGKGGALELGTQTMWLVLSKAVVAEEEVEAGQASEVGK
ncbi:hypothetical protein CC79DRAFT_1328674 [Sarocladium strictum]